MNTPGKTHHLRRAATPAGHFVILAIDHRANLRASLDKHAPHPLTDDEFTAFKQTVMAHLAPLASGVLVDPAYGIGPGIASGNIDAHRGLLAPLEVTDYSVHPSQRTMQLIPGWSVAKIKKVGGDGVKLLLNYHPDAADAAEKRALVARIVEECATHDIPFFLEPLAYSLAPARSLPGDELRQVVIDMARTFSAMGVDVLKLQFPVDARQETDRNRWRAACRELAAACTVPWALLSAGVDYATFAEQARIACEAGASGVIVGRAIWAEAVALQGAARDAFLASTARARMQELAAICAVYAAPWNKHATPPEWTGDWYMAS
ncbi:MAG: tagatose 1,6-diphosphate aldolase [Anaerolineae bacterium]